jgi:hypothetical protein
MAASRQEQQQPSFQYSQLKLFDIAGLQSFNNASAELGVWPAF